MSGEREPESIAEAPGAAWAALSAADREHANAFLEEQKKLVRLQAEELRRELKLHHWSARFHHVSSILKLAFETAVAFVVLVIAALIGNAVWGAVHDHGLVIEAFHVPPDLASRGLTGEVVAGRMLDKLAAMQAQTDSVRPAGSYTNNWGDDIKVQIPDTGVSIGEFDRYLKQWLGDETRITGDVVRTGNALSVTARVGATAAQSFSGPEGDLDTLLQHAAEAVYARTQPYRYGVFLIDHGRDGDAQTVFAELSRTGSPTDRSWAYMGLGNVQGERNRPVAALEATRHSVGIRADFALGWLRVGDWAYILGREEETLTAKRRSRRLFENSAADDFQPERAAMFGPTTAGVIDDILGNYADEVKQYIALRDQPGAIRSEHEQADYFIANGLAQAHDPKAARAVIANAPAITEASTLGKGGPVVQEYQKENGRFVEVLGAAAQGNWGALLTEARAADALEAKLDRAGTSDFYRPTEIWPLLALAEAMSGGTARAGALIGRTPLDCGPCLRVRGKIRAAEKNWNAAAFWFAGAAKQGPSIPFADSDWGEMLLRKGDYNGAIAKFALAHAKGSHFADPLEMWGEALMQKNRSDLALAKFSEANRYAPNWGRLHLEWGKALMWTGDKEGAKKQFDIAAHLDLSANDKSSLMTWEKRI